MESDTLQVIIDTKEHPGPTGPIDSQGELALSPEDSDALLAIKRQAQRDASYDDRPTRWGSISLMYFGLSDYVPVSRWTKFIHFLQYVGGALLLGLFVNFVSGRDASSTP